MITLTLSLLGNRAIPDFPIRSLNKLYFFDQFSLYLKTYPRKWSSVPLNSEKILVFSLERDRPLSDKKASTAGLINISIIRLLGAMTTKSSAYRTVLTLNVNILVLTPFL